MNESPRYRRDVDIQNGRLAHPIGAEIALPCSVLRGETPEPLWVRCSLLFTQAFEVWRTLFDERGGTLCRIRACHEAVRGNLCLA